MAISQWPFHLGGSRDRAGDRHAAHADGSTAHRTDRQRIAPCLSYNSDSHQYSSSNGINDQK
jgi:hypothetical protein